MSINSLMLSMGEAVYFTPSLRNTLEAHMPLLRQSPNTTAIDVDAKSAAIFKADLTGFLAFRRIELYMHWIIMRASFMQAPHEFGPAITTLLIPNKTDLNRIVQAHNTSGKIRS